MTTDLPESLKRLMARRPRTDAEVEQVVEEIESFIRALEQQQLDLTKGDRERRSDTMCEMP
jgi:hypothetical protein